VATYDRGTGRLLATATAPGTEHLNSGFVHDGRLYCGHSNYPATPPESDIRVLDPETGGVLLAGRSHVPCAPLWARASLRTASLPTVPPGGGGPHGGCVVAQKLARSTGVARVLGSCC
jgi:hypothetical protein